MLIRSILFWLSFAASAAEPSVYQWRDQNGVTHFSDSENNSKPNGSGIKESYWQTQAQVIAKSPAPPPASKTHTQRKLNDDGDTRQVLSAECEWLRGRIANLRRLTRGNAESVFNDELERRQSEWKKTQCQRGTHVWNRDLLPTRKAAAKQK